VISHPEKLLFLEDGITKADLAAYYELVAPLMLPHIRGRPVTMERYPSGIGKTGFMQKDVSKGFPDWLKRVEVPKKGGTVHHPLANDTRSLLWLANQNCITPHVWTTQTPNLYQPDVCVFDLDPSVDDPPILRRAALDLRDLLAELSLPSWLKTTGSRGYHIVVPLDGHADFEAVWQFAHDVGRVLVKRDPDHLTQEFTKVRRGDRILIDTGRNAYSATFAAPYAVRPRPGAPVSAPCTWEELEGGSADPQAFTLRNMGSRRSEVGDLWVDMPPRAMSLRPAREQLTRLLEAEVGPIAELPTRRGFRGKDRPPKRL
jgi:bifunctional non-homologous end joining protein LigD